MRVIRQGLVLLGLVVALFFVLYWIKCQFGLDTVKSWHLGDYLPVQILQGHGDRDHLFKRSAVPPAIIDDGFDVAFFKLDPWGALWMREPGKVQRLFPNAAPSGSRCLVIRNTGLRDWTYQSDILVEVAPGDVFRFEGLTRESGGAEGRMSVMLYDANKNVLEWNYAIQYARRSNWSSISNRFSVPWGTRYIRLRLAGTGVGDVSFDDIRFVREVPPPMPDSHGHRSGT